MFKAFQSIIICNNDDQVPYDKMTHAHILNN